MAKPLKVQNPLQEPSPEGQAEASSIGWVAVLYWGALAAGIAMRMAELGARALHHDESIHGTFSYQWLDTPSTSYYKYDPTYHGPFLYIITRLLFSLFGVGVAQARLFPLLFGTAVVFSPLLLRRWMGKTAAWIAVGCLAVSPLNIYYSRFLAHDMPSLCFAVGCLAAFLAYLTETENKRRWLCLSLGSLGLLFSVKAVSFLYVFIYATGGLLLVFLDNKKEERPLLDAGTVKSALGPGAGGMWFLATAVFLACYGVIQTSLFHNPDGFVDGLFGRVIGYWWGQHRMERLTGPTIFHIRSLLLHELPICAIVFAYVLRYLRAPRWCRYSLYALVPLFLLMIPIPWKVADFVPAGMNGVLDFLKVKTSGDLFLYFFCFVFGIFGTLRAFEYGQKVTAFLIYWTFSSLAIFSFAGEKTPWLTLHPLYPAILLSGVAIAHWVTELKLDAWLGPWRPSGRLSTKQRVALACAALACFYQLRLSYIVNFVTAGEPRDLLSQVHNTKDVSFVVDWMKRVSYETGEKTTKMPIALVGDIVWAFYFYLIQDGYKTFVLDAASVDGRQRFVVLDEKNEKDTGPKLLGMGYRLSKLDHSGWWVPEHGPVSWLDWASYAWSRNPPNPVGLTPLFVYFKPLDARTPAEVPPAPAKK